MRLYVMAAIDDVLGEIHALRRALAAQARAHATVVMPGYTHLQRAQPVYFAHHALAYFEMLGRDAERFRQARRRTDVMPLGSGALAGVPYPIDRESVAAELGFGAISANSMDAVSDRDFLLDFHAAAATCAVHMSRMGEELVLWTSDEFAFVRLPDEYTTGSSMMPQKRNPDFAELARGRTGRVIGNLVSLLTVLKGLPLTYNRDLQEDKEGFFDTLDTLLGTLRVMTGMYESLELDGARLRRAAEASHVLATDIADYLVARGMPFREAHGVSARLSIHASSTGRTLSDLSMDDYRQFSDLFARGRAGDYCGLVDRGQGRSGRLSVSPGRAGNRGRRARRWRLRPVADRAIRIVPSILSADFAALGDQIAEAEAGGADGIHVDIMDGRFVPQLTFGPMIVKAIRGRTSLPLDVHMMVMEPQNFVDELSAAGADVMTVHAESPVELASAVQQVKDAGMRAGVAINPGTPAAAIDDVLPVLDMVLVMTVNPGYAGQAFIESVVGKIAQMRATLDERGLPVEIEVDGGIGPATAGIAAAAGADALVAGSAVYGGGRCVAQAIADLRSAAAEGLGIYEAACARWRTVPSASPGQALRPFDKPRRDSGQDCRRIEARFDKLAMNGLSSSTGRFHSRGTGRRLVHLGGLSHG